MDYQEGDVLFNDALNTFYLRLYGIWLRTILIVRKETHCRHIGSSFRLPARVLLYAPSHRQDSTYHSLCYTSHGAQAGMRNSSMGPPHEGSIRRPIAPWASALTTELHLAPVNYQYHVKLKLVTEPKNRTLRNLYCRCKENIIYIWRKEMFYLTTHSTHFIYGYMASDIWLRTTQIAREETRCRPIGYSFRSAARVLLYASSHRQERYIYIQMNAHTHTVESWWIVNSTTWLEPRKKIWIFWFSKYF